jgi:chorismate--pyruvate lyase
VNRWLAHLPPGSAPSCLRPWLLEPGSLTARLQAHSRHFEVRLLRQSHGVCRPDQARMIGLARAARVREREVLLCCDGQPVVYAHTVTALSSAADWPFFHRLGQRSLGTALFSDPLIARGCLQHARLHARHALARRAAAAAPACSNERVLHARRCLYRRHRGLLLVTELFLPTLARLARLAPRR